MKIRTFLNKYDFAEIVMNKYSCLTMKERIDKIGELLAKGVYLYLKNEKERKKDGRIVKAMKVNDDTITKIVSLCSI